MDLIIPLLIVVFGLLPPIAVGYFSYRQGRKGYNEAIESRDIALAGLNNIEIKVSDVINKLDALPNEKTLLDKIQKSVQGSYGQLIRNAKAGAEGAIEEMADDVIGSMSQEDQMAMMGQKVQGALMQKVMNFFNKD